jgi:hypothetical protein
VVNVLDFGADPTGVIDSYTSILAAITASKGTVYFPNGNYKTSSGFVINKNIKIFGDGFASKITYTGTGTLFTLQHSTVNDDSARYQIESIYLYNEQQVADCCIELQYTGSAGIVGGVDRLYISNVLVDTFPSKYWKKALFINRSGGVYISDSSFVNGNYGPAENIPGVYGIHLLNNLSGHNMIRSVSITNSYLQRFYHCIFIENTLGANIESIYVTNTELLGGYILNGVGNSASIAFLGCHFDAVNQAINLPRTQIVRLIGNDFSNRSGAIGPILNFGQAGLTPSTDLVEVVGNSFNNTTSTILQVLGGNQYTITSNTFRGNSLNTGIAIAGTCGAVRVVANQFLLIGTQITNTTLGGDIGIGVTGVYDVLATNNMIIQNGCIVSIS